jgi:proteic killer suppression protein
MIALLPFLGTITIDVNNVQRYATFVIKSFADSQTEQFYVSGKSRRLPVNLLRVAKRKLFQLEYARQLSDLAAPPGNRLEALKGEREGQYSIRINDQYRLCFEFRNGDAYEVEIVDYH